MKLNSFQGDLYIWGNLKLLPFWACGLFIPLQE